MFPDLRYESLEDPDTRLFAFNDPRKFLESEKKMIIDEIQRVPELFSYIQTITDKKNISGQYLISGSQSFLLNQHISQSLAGRVAILNLMPLSFSELRDNNTPIKSYEKLIYQGFYPRLYDKVIDPGDFYPNYIQTYIERDVRLLQNIHDLTLFVRFLKLCAGRFHSPADGNQSRLRRQRALRQNDRDHRLLRLHRLEGGDAGTSLGMNVIGHDTVRDRDIEGVCRAEIPELVARSDFITVHTPLNDATRGLIGKERIAGDETRGFPA